MDHINGMRFSIDSTGVTHIAGPAGRGGLVAHSRFTKDSCLLSFPSRKM